MFKLKNLHPAFGVEIIGIDLSGALEPNDFAQIELVLEQYSLVLFRNQIFDDDSQVAVSRRTSIRSCGLWSGAKDPIHRLHRQCR